MLADLHDGVAGPLAADVAVIGAGAAGITLARRLIAGGLSVILLESGGIDYEAPYADLNDGANLGEEYYPLRDARLRQFGGTTAIWGGRCARFNAIDFKRRPWVPHSGWPLSLDEIEPYYAEALRLFGLPPTEPDDRAVRASGVSLPRFDEDEIAVHLWTFDGRFDRFAVERCDDLVRSPRCTVLTHATVREIVADPDGARIARLDVADLGGGTVCVAAKDYILAAGGIENPRLLLVSNSVLPGGLGNHRDLVGRFFMEHPHARGGRIVGRSSWALFDAFAKRRLDGTTIAPLIAPSALLQEREGLLNTSLTIAPRRPASGREAWLMRAYLHAKHSRAPDRFGRTLWKATKRTVGWLQQRTDPFRPWLLNHLGRLDQALVVRGEQAPNPDSRVVLTSDRDALGMQRAALDWRLSPIDVESVKGLVGALGREVERLGLGRVEPAEWLSEEPKRWATDPLISAHPIGGYHHMGTTRMAADPGQGVTDGDGRVHGLDNLYVAGSSLFPTSGWANPTLTIVALALRTADRLTERAARR